MQHNGSQWEPCDIGTGLHKRRSIRQTERPIYQSEVYKGCSTAVRAAGCSPSSPLFDLTHGPLGNICTAVQSAGMRLVRTPRRVHGTVLNGFFNLIWFENCQGSFSLGSDPQTFWQKVCVTDWMKTSKLYYVAFTEGVSYCFVFMGNMLTLVYHFTLSLRFRK